MNQSNERNENVPQTNESLAEKDGKKILIYHNAEEYLSKTVKDGKTEEVIENGEKKLNESDQPTDPLICYKDFCKKFFRRAFDNIVILSAAGTSKDNESTPEESPQKTTSNQGKTREELWNDCQVPLTKILDEIYKKIKQNNLRERCDNEFVQSKDFEKALSFIELYYGIISDDISEGIKENYKEIHKIIKEDCSLTLGKNAPHEEFLRKITAKKKNSNRVQLFTTNYDTLWEQAASKAGFIVIDGFSFSHPRKFSGFFFDLDIVNREKTRTKNEDNFIPNVIHLYKLHGSVDWTQDEENNIIQTDKECDDTLMVYPASNKYKSSYEQPYFEMMSRFQQALKKENTLLLVMGFGFQDKHIERIIYEAVKKNPSLHLVILDYNDEKTINLEKYQKKFSGAMSKVTIIFSTFKEFTNMYPQNETYLENYSETNI